VGRGVVITNLVLRGSVSMGKKSKGNAKGGRGGQAASVNARLTTPGLGKAAMKVYQNLVKPKVKGATKAHRKQLEAMQRMREEEARAAQRQPDADTDEEEEEEEESGGSGSSADEHVVRDSTVSAPEAPDRRTARLMDIRSLWPLWKPRAGMV
jgi:hypothetical protein